MKLYLAGPLFTRGELNFNAELAKLLRARGYEVHLPQETEQQLAGADAIFKSDVAGVDWADTVVACMDGPDPDSGTCWEVGYAFGIGKDIVLYRTDFRNETPMGPYNLMLHQSADIVLDCQWHSVEDTALKIDVALGELK